MEAITVNDKAKRRAVVAPLTRMLMPALLPAEQSVAVRLVTTQLVAAQMGAGKKRGQSAIVARRRDGFTVIPLFVEIRITD